ncbi:MAG: DUF4231 domain-containing protein [Anaerolineae bacterium]|nr:DUF4231 domain-containing protein [Anaerolineae bacterium]
MSLWVIGILVYISFVSVTLVPVLCTLTRSVRLHPGGSSFEESPLFSEEAKARLIQHYSRIEGTLGFWKKQAEIYKHLHYYCLCWTIPSSVIIPFLAQAVTEDPYSKWLITIVSAYTAILLSFHKALKVDAHYKAFRQGESEFYDLRRRMLDRPTTFGKTEQEQLEHYFDAVENVRKYIRNAEIDNLPTIEQVKVQLANEEPSDLLES